MTAGDQNIIKSSSWKWTGLAVFALGVFWVLGYNLILGYGILSNDSHYYLRHGIGIQEHGFSHIARVKLPFYYWFLPTILATLRTLFGEAWKEGYLTLQCLSSGAFFLGCYRLAEHLRGWKAGLIAVGFALVCNEYLSWSRYVLTDILFSAIALWFVYALLRQETLAWKDTGLWIGVFFLLFFVTIARPVGFLYPFAISIYLFQKVVRKAERQWKVAVALALLLMVAAGAFVIALLWDDYGLQRYLNVFVEFFRDGVVIKNRPVYNLPAEVFVNGNVWAKIVFVSEVVLFRCVTFWNPFIIGYSIPHLVFNGLTLFPMFVLSLYAFVRNFRGQFLALLAILFSVTLFHAFTLVDYDHRYRVPLLGFVLVLAGIGLLDLLADLRKLGCKQSASVKNEPEESAS